MKRQLVFLCLLTLLACALPLGAKVWERMKVDQGFEAIQSKIESVIKEKMFQPGQELYSYKLQPVSPERVRSEVADLGRKVAPIFGAKTTSKLAATNLRTTKDRFVWKEGDSIKVRAFANSGFMEVVPRSRTPRCKRLPEGSSRRMGY